MRETILEQLHELEKSQSIRILFACESGSRAWGFHSPDSDYDVRFVYAQEKDVYLGIEDKKDFIEFPKDEVLDIVGYDVRKMLKLFRASNAKIFEWIQSPIMYMKDDSFLAGIRSLVPEYYSEKAGIHHYVGLTNNTFKNYLQEEKVKLKKYFYAFRPIMAALWITHEKECPPMQFHLLRQVVQDKLVNEKIDELLAQKATVGEGFVMPPDELLNKFILQQIEAITTYASNLDRNVTDASSLNALFRKTIGIS